MGDEGSGIDIASKMAADGGVSSRKLWLTILAMVLIVVCAGMAGIMAGIAANLPSVVSGILGALGIYCGANVSSRWVAAGVAKAVPAKTKAPKKTEEEGS